MPKRRGICSYKVKWYNGALEARRVVDCRVSSLGIDGLGDVHQGKHADAGRDVDASR